MSKVFYILKAKECWVWQKMDSGGLGFFVIRFVENMIRGTAEGMNPFTMLATAAIMYFIFLMYFKRKYGG